MSKTVRTGLAGLILFTPTLAIAEPRTMLDVFGDAAPEVKLIILLLLVAMVAAIVVAVRKLRSGEALNGGSAFLSGLRLGGPLLGALGAAYTGLCSCIGLANVPGPVPVRVLAPGFAEIVFQLMLGFLVGSVAVIANWAVESRIDRQVLRG